MPHKLLDTPPYSDIYFTGHGFQRIPRRPQAYVRVTNYYDGKPQPGVTQNEEDVDVNVDTEAADFINWTVHQHHHHDSLKKKLKEMPHKLLDTPPYSDIYFTGHGFQRIPRQPQAYVRVTNYYDGKPQYGVTQNEEDVDVNVDTEAADFIKLRHNFFET
ncbi:hypothetical protein L6452_12890 [Arctium lappa]|uniref:Uncharacterized protein n=1 Tax=Arctium lappa TaxID=4217 RepID=A0ACB9CGP4_ARCLA|nr:hypothetical protein L6452_12890 [Arctium lappa]